MQKFRLNPFLVFKPLGDKGLVLDDYFSKRTYTFQKDSVPKLLYFLRWRTSQSFPAAKGKATLTKRQFSQLVSKDIILAEDHPIWKMYRKARRWRDRNHADSLFFHLNCYQYPFINYETAAAFDIDTLLMGKYYRQRKNPSPYKIYRGTSISLPSPEPLPNISLREMVSSPQLRKPVPSTLPALSALLHASFGQTDYAAGTIAAIRKTTPSGGSKHPTEVYILTFGNYDIPAGVYHYSVKKHALDVIRTGKHLSDLAQATRQTLAVKRGEGQPALGIVYTSRVERAMWRYRDVRSTRAFFVDAGHASHGARLNGKAYGLECTSEYMVDSESLASLLKTDVWQEPILCAQLFYWPT